MADRIQNVTTHSRASSSRPRPGQPEEEITRENGAAHNNRPRFIESSSQSQQQTPIHQSQTQSQHRYQTPMISISDSDSESSSEGRQSEDDGADGVAEAQHGGYPATSLIPASSPPLAGEAIPLLLTNPAMLYCSICHNPLLCQIFLCDNGHTACFACLYQTRDRCPSCIDPNKFNRSRGFEKLLRSLQIQCDNKNFGCKETFPYHDKSDHEKICRYTKCVCPFTSCGFFHIAHFVYSHVYRDHAPIPFFYNTAFDLFVRIDQKYVVLQERHKKVIFIVNHAVREHGRSFNIDCIGPGSLKEAFVYQLTVKKMDEYCCSMKSVPEIWTEWKEHTPNKNYITIPSDITEFSIQVCIKKAHPVTSLLDMS